MWPSNAGAEGELDHVEILCFMWIFAERGNVLRKVRGGVWGGSRPLVQPAFVPAVPAAPVPTSPGPASVPGHKVVPRPSARVSQVSRRDRWPFARQQDTCFSPNGSAEVAMTETRAGFGVYSIFYCRFQPGLTTREIISFSQSRKGCDGFLNNWPMHFLELLLGPRFRRNHTRHTVIYR
jgi:hypothetical protein